MSWKLEEEQGDWPEEVIRQVLEGSETMRRITLTDDLRAKLRGLEGAVQLCDVDGYHLATIEPTIASDPRSRLVTYTEELYESLGDLAEGIEFSDENGTLIARIAPCSENNTDFPMAMSRLDEFKRRRALGVPTYTTDELVQRLRER